MMPKIAEGDANKVWIVPSEIGKALEGLGSTMTDLAGHPAAQVDGPAKRVDMGSTERRTGGSGALGDARAEAGERRRRGRDRRGRPGRQPAARQTPRRRPTRPSTPVRCRRDRRYVSPFEVVAILLAGVAAGTINTVVGSGTLITFPTLLAFGIPPVTANVSNTIGLVPGLGLGRDRLPPRAGGSAVPDAPARRAPR